MNRRAPAPACPRHSLHNHGIRASRSRLSAQRTGDPCLGHLLAEGLQGALRIPVAAGRRDIQPSVCLSCVLRHTHTLGVHDAQGILGADVSLFRRPAVPGGRLPSVLRHPITLRGHETQVELGASRALFGRPAKPRGRLGVALRDSLAFVEPDGQVELGVGVPFWAARCSSSTSVIGVAPSNRRTTMAKAATARSARSVRCARSSASRVQSSRDTPLFRGTSHRRMATGQGRRPTSATSFADPWASLPACPRRPLLAVQIRRPNR